MPAKLKRLEPPGLAGQAPAPRAYESQRSRQLDKNFYSTARWRRVRTAKLNASPLCVDCRAAGRATLADHVHHVKPRKARPDLAYDLANLEGLCQPCHNARPGR
jgi:5-methylcytosine-specific restriction enzyme A